MNKTISIQLLADILGLPKETTPSTILETITQLVTFKETHLLCRSSFNQISADIEAIKIGLEVKYNKLL